jgi:hypothetical protein
MQFLRTSLLSVAALTLASTVAHAGPGLRVGVTSDPDSLFGGLQWRVPLSQVGPGKLMLQPGADIGIVDGPVDLFLRGTLHLGYMIPVSNDLSVYPLVGPSLVWAKAGDASDTNIGLDVGVGGQFKNFALELWFGAVDSFDVTVGLSFNL